MKNKANVAYIILAHKNFTQLNQLIHQLLTDGEGDIFIHIDRKSIQEVEGRLPCDKRVTILDKSFSIEWGDISMVDATLLLFHRVLSLNIKYDFVCLLSGQDMMIKAGVEEFLADRIGENFIEVEQVDPYRSIASQVYLRWPKHARKRYSYWHPYRWLRSVVPRLYKIGLNIFYENDKLADYIKLYRGSQWFCLSFETVSYIVKFLSTHPWFYAAFENSFVPDEWFFHTLIMNSSYAKTVINDKLAYLIMGTELRNRNHPLTIKFSDIQSIECSNKFFARKFDPGIDAKVIDYFYRKIVKGSARD